MTADQTACDGDRDHTEPEADDRADDAAVEPLPDEDGARGKHESYGDRRSRPRARPGRAAGWRSNGSAPSPVASAVASAASTTVTAFTSIALFYRLRPR